MSKTIYSPMPTGSGAIVVHKSLQTHLSDYHVQQYSPKLTYFPPYLKFLSKCKGKRLLHTAPDHGCLFYREDTPMIITFHNFVLDREMDRFSNLAQKLHYRTDLRFFIKRSLSLSTSVTAVSKFTADLVAREMGFNGEIRVIPNGIDVDRFTPRKTLNANRKGKLKILIPGNPSIRKGTHWLSKIASHVKDFAKLYCTFNKNDVLYRRFDVNGLNFIGKSPHSKMPEIYKEFDAVLLPTVREGDSLALLEAMSAGLPVIASDCSSIPERVDQGLGGYLCEIGDTKMFAKSIEDLLDPSVTLRMGQYNRAKAERHFGIAKMVSAYEELFGPHL